MIKIDFFISGVWKNDNGRITDVLLHKVNENERFGLGIKTPEQVVIRHIENDKIVLTLNWGYPGWKRGVEVGVVSDGNDKFLRTDPNSKIEDNLDNLIKMNNWYHG